MKRKSVYVSLAMISLLIIQTFGQSEKYSFIPSSHLGVTYNKTTNLVFPFSVQSIDRGSKDILVQQPKGTQNIVQLKAGKPNFEQTSLSVITVDGKLYSFIVDYISQPSQLNIIVPNTGELSLEQPVKLSSAKNEAAYLAVAEKINATNITHGKKDKNGQMKLQLHGVYIDQDVLYFRLTLTNKANISYDPESIRFSIKDKQKARRTASQEMEVQPVYQYGSLKNLPGDSSASFIVALSKFTLPASKYLSIQILERNGGRNLNLTLKSRHIMNARLIRDYND